MPKPPKFSHLQADGTATMVGIGHKAVVFRRAAASGKLLCAPGTIRLLKRKALPKGDVLGVARIAGIQAVKRTADLIPLCHPLPIHRIEVDFRVRANAIEITCTVETEAKTGVEMEALTGVTVAALTLYDMCKAVDKGMMISEVGVVEKIKDLVSAKRSFAGNKGRSQTESGNERQRGRSQTESGNEWKGGAR